MTQAKYPTISTIVAAIRGENYNEAEKLLTHKNAQDCDAQTNQTLLELSLQLVNVKLVESLELIGSDNDNLFTNPINLSEFSYLPRNPIVIVEAQRTKFIKLLIRYGASVLLPSIQEIIKQQPSIYEKELIFLLEDETKNRRNLKSNLYSLFKEKKNCNPVVQEVPNEVFKAIYNSTGNS